MKHAMHNWMRPEPIETTLERLHRFGYDAIEISGDRSVTTQTKFAVWKNTNWNVGAR